MIGSVFSSRGRYGHVPAYVLVLNDIISPLESMTRLYRVASSDIWPTAVSLECSNKPAHRGQCFKSVCKAARKREWGSEVFGNINARVRPDQSTCHLHSLNVALALIWSHSSSSSSPQPSSNKSRQDLSWFDMPSRQIVGASLYLTISGEP